MMGSQDEFLKGSLSKLPGKTPVKMAKVEWPILWPFMDKIMVRPMDPPKESGGGILLSEKTVSAEIALTTVGQVMDVGSLCFTANTKDGVDYSKEKRQVTVGTWILYRKHAGQPVFVRQGNDGQKLDKNRAPRLLVMTEEDILGVFKNEEEARKVWAWCG